MTWSMSKADTLALPIDALAILILKSYEAAGGWNWQNWMRGAEQYGNASDPDINAALGEGWAWLMTCSLSALTQYGRVGRRARGAGRDAARGGACPGRRRSGWRTAASSNRSGWCESVQVRLPRASTQV
jgi:hypothetical protein